MLNLASPSIPAASCATYFSLTFSSGVDADDIAHATPIANSSANGIEDNNLSWNTVITGANAIDIRACNPTAAAINPANDQEWLIHTFGY